MLYSGLHTKINAKATFLGLQWAPKNSVLAPAGQDLFAPLHLLRYNHFGKDKIRNEESLLVALF